LNVMTEGDFIEKGSPVRIIRIQGANIIVRKVKQEREGS
jgi:membrane-bound ClpP family serine protease